MRKVIPDVVMTSQEMMGEWKMSGAGAFLSKHGGKVIEISGSLRSSAYENGKRDDRGYVVLGPDTDRFDCSDPHPVSKAVPGQKVILRGRCDPMLGVREGAIVRVEGDPPPTLSAEQLAKDFEADEKGTVKKFKEKYLVLTGTIQNIKKDSFGIEVVLTPPDAKNEIVCSISHEALAVAERHGWLKTGQRVRVLGEWVFDNPKLFSCVIVPPAE